MITKYKVRIALIDHEQIVINHSILKITIFLEDKNQFHKTRLRLSCTHCDKLCTVLAEPSQPLVGNFFFF